MVFLFGFSLLILSLPLLGLVYKSTSHSLEFYVRRPRQNNTIYSEFDLFSVFFVSSCLIVWVNGVESMDVATVRGCWLKDLHQIQSVSWIHHYSLHFHIHYIASFVPRISWSLYCYFKWWGNRKVLGWFIYVRVWVGGQLVGIIFFSVFVLLLIALLWLVHDSLLRLFNCSYFAFFVSGPFN